MVGVVGLNVGRVKYKPKYQVGFRNLQSALRNIWQDTRDIVSMICSQGLFDIFHLIGRLSCVVQTFLVGSPEEQHAGTAVLQNNICQGGNLENILRIIC